jgi:Sec-independent protein translocase protein TatA
LYSSAGEDPLSILEIFLVLVVALVVIPPDRLPEVMRVVGRVLRELRLASNTIVRELSGAIEDPTYMSDRVHSNPITAPWSKSDSETGTDQSPETPEPPPRT